MDDSSRLITCYGVFDSPTTENTITVLNRGFRKYGTPREIRADHGTQFVSDRNRELANHTFGDFLDQNHPQTNGKIERFFEEVQRRIDKCGSIEKIVHWQNVIKPHMSLDYDEPSNVFWYRLPPGGSWLCAEMVIHVKLIRDTTHSIHKGPVWLERPCDTVQYMLILYLQPDVARSRTSPPIFIVCLNLLPCMNYNP